MNKVTITEEIAAKKKAAINDFTLLSRSGLVGNYVECEFTHIVIEEVETKKLHHYFGIVCFEEFHEPDDLGKPKTLNPPQRNLSAAYKIGIYQFRITIDEAHNIFEQLNIGDLTFRENQINLPSQLVCLPKAFVPHLWDHSPPSIAKVLKPTVFGDSYIIEHFSHVYSIETQLTRPAIEKANKIIRDVLNIDLDSISDRIGSFLFQFPISTVETKARLDSDRCGAVITVESVAETFPSDDIETQIITRFDDIVTGFATETGYLTNKRLQLGDSNNFEFLTYCKGHQLILSHYKCHFVRSFNFSFGVAGSRSEPRVIIDKAGKTSEISLTDYSMGGTEGVQHFDTRIRNRIIQNDILSKRGRFKVLEGNQREEALVYLNELINSGQSSEIWLIDPFLNARDLLDTVYHCSKLNVQVRCLSSLKKVNEISDVSEDIANFRNHQVAELKQFSNNLGINLEWRAVHDSHGKQFHDRYLMMVPADKEALPTIYSLGTSINSLGASHHLIQQALDPRELETILRSFWALLDNPCCLVARIKNGKFV